MVKLATLIAVAPQAAGCIIDTTGDDSGGGGNTATISARWALRNMSNGTSTPCPSGFDTAQLKVLGGAVESISTRVADATRAHDDKLTCGDHVGVITTTT